MTRSQIHILIAVFLLCPAGCGDDTQAQPDPPQPIGEFVYGVTPGFCSSPCESYELYRNDDQLQLLVFVENERFDREILGELTPNSAATLDELAEALSSGDSELGELDPACATLVDAPQATLALAGTQITLSYPTPCPPSGVADIHAILDEITAAFASCEGSIHALTLECPNE